MSTIVSVVQIITGILLAASIIMQQRGSSMGIAFGGSGETFRSKRGIEKILFYATIVLAAIFAASSILSLVSQ